MRGCKSETEAEKDVESVEKKIEKITINPNTELGQLYAELKFISDRMREEDHGAQCEDEWKYVASVFDRLKFWKKKYFEILIIFSDFVESFILSRYSPHLLERWSWVYDIPYVIRI